MKGKCHFIGIGGIGMSGLARIMLENNVEVSGSDVSENPIIASLVEKGAQVRIGHDARFVTPEATVVYSSDIKDNNPEYQAALSMSCRMMHRSDLLAALIQEQKLLGVIGAHGKTSTSALLAHVLQHAGKDPSYALGGLLKANQTNAGRGKGDYFVAELDESDGSFLKFNAHNAIITNIGRDHMNFFKSKEELLRCFKVFIENVTDPEGIFWCGDNMYLNALSPKGVSYGFCDHCQLRAHNVQQEGWNLNYDITFRGKSYNNISIPLIGSHNVLNSLAVFGLATKLGIDSAVIAEAFSSFQGVHRRCEKKGEVNGISVIDDYAHHPTEISSTLNGLRLAFEERRIIVVYQPHRYSRIRDCAGSFGGVFDDADEVYITEIYSAGEAPIPGVSHQGIIEENEQVAAAQIKHVPRKDVIERLLGEVRPYDVVVTLGAGDITKVGDQFLNALRQQL